MKVESHSIREARPDEAGALSELALRSKAHWGYSREFLDSCRSELSVDPDRIGSPDYQCFVAVDESVVLGFYIVTKASEDTYELEALFVEPHRIGTGVGRSLLQRAVRSLSRQGAARLVIQGDPHANEFYIAAGARKIGSKESGSIPGRYLPLFEIDIENP